jgi:predicted methyltransferase
MKFEFHPYQLQSYVREFRKQHPRSGSSFEYDLPKNKIEELKEKFDPIYQDGPDQVPAFVVSVKFSPPMATITAVR